VDLTEITQRLTRRFGPGVADWCAGLPALVGVLAGRWALSPGEAFPSGNSSVVIRCTRSGGPAAVLKLSPDLPVVAEQVATLKLFGAGGRVPAVLAADVAAGAVLLDLLATESTRVLLHGDLHLANVLDGGPGRGLVAIDPRACTGDPCFDAVDYLLDGAGRDGVEARCTALALASGRAAGGRRTARPRPVRGPRPPAGCPAAPAGRSTPPVPRGAARPPSRARLLRLARADWTIPASDPAPAEGPAVSCQETRWCTCRPRR
jgi:Aminoglycoside/hydroxyurea antibiotic resistance kinase